MGYRTAPPPLPDEADGGGDGATPDTPRRGMREPHSRRPASPQPRGTAAGGTGSTACRSAPWTARQRHRSAAASTGPSDSDRAPPRPRLRATAGAGRPREKNIRSLQQ